MKGRNLSEVPMHELVNRFRRMGHGVGAVDGTITLNPQIHLGIKMLGLMDYLSKYCRVTFVRHSDLGPRHHEDKDKRRRQN